MTRNNLLNLVFIGLAAFALKDPYFYCFLLFDVVRISEVLNDVLKSVRKRRKQISLTLIFGVIIVYLFGIVAFLFFGDDYSNSEDDTPSTYCETLLEWVTSTITVGVRAGGGIGDWIKKPTLDDEDHYWARYPFDLLFFIVVLIILLNIIFGIIIDTFAELRDAKKATAEDLDNFCMMCGREKHVFEQHGNGWAEHTSSEHNVYAYLSYIIYVYRKPFEKCDGLEKIMKKKIENGDVSFFPTTAICLEAYDAKQNDDPSVEAEDTPDD